MAGNSECFNRIQPFFVAITRGNRAVQSSQFRKSGADFPAAAAGLEMAARRFDPGEFVRAITSADDWVNNRRETENESPHSQSVGFRRNSSLSVKNPRSEVVRRRKISS